MHRDIEDKELSTGDVFLAFNKSMTPPKMKYHLVIDERMSFLVNTKPSEYSCKVTPADCSIFTHECYIDCSRIRLEPYSKFEIVKVSELSEGAIIRLIEKVRCSIGLTPIQIRKVVEQLEKVIR